MSTHRVAVAAVLASTLLIGACGSTDDPAGDTSGLDLTGRTFIGDQVTQDDEPYPLVKGSQIRLTFDEDTIGASAGCNTLGGDASWADGTLVVDTLAGTEMGCDQALMDQDTWLADLLTSTPTLLLADDTLTLTSGGTVVVLSDEEVVVPDASLTGTAWVLDSIITGDAASSVPEGVQSTLQLKPSGLAFAELGCNTGRGGYQVDGSTITFEPMATTRMACEETAMSVEDAVLAVLQGDVGFSIDGESLVLTPTSVSGNAPSQLVYRVG
jgi:heat shock protein HslJ